MSITPVPRRAVLAAGLVTGLGKLVPGLVTGGTAGLLTGINTAFAQSADAAYPTKAIHLMIPFSAGGGSDLIGRLVAQRLAEVFKQPVVVDNKPGAGGSIGSREVARAPGDGYTLLLATSSTHGINPWIYSSLGYDVAKDFAPVAMLATSDYGLAVPAASPARSVADLIEMGKSGKLDFASSGNGTTSHLAGAWFANATRSPFTHIPYKASAPAITDLIGGQIAYYFDNTSVLLPHAKSGKLRILATSGTSRARAAPDIPTLLESGVPNYDLIGWWCVLAPATTPQPIIDRLSTEIMKIINTPQVQEYLIGIGDEPLVMTPADTRVFMAKQLASYKTIVELAKAKAD